MKRYQFPADLGSVEHEAADDKPGFPNVGFDLSGLSTRLWLERVDLTEVLPPLPEEPGRGAVVLDRFIRAWQHVGGGRGDWCCTEDDLGADWGELNHDYGPLTRLVPAPVVEPVTLPWKSHGVEVQQTTLDSGPGNHVHVSTKDASYGFAHLKPDVADAMAAALTTAAAKARQTDVS